MYDPSGENSLLNTAPKFAGSRVTIPDFTLDSPLNLRQELEIQTTLKRTRNKNYPLHTYEYEVASLCRLGMTVSSDIIKSYAMFREAGAPTTEEIDREMRVVKASQMHDGHAQDLFKGLNTCFWGFSSPFPGDAEQVDLRSTWKKLQDVLNGQTFVSANIQRLITLARILEVGIIWSNKYEERDDPDFVPASVIEEYGWTREYNFGRWLIGRFFDAHDGEPARFYIQLSKQTTVLIDTKTGHRYVAPKKFLLCEKDLCVQRWITLMNCEWLDGHRCIRLPTADLVNQLYSIGDQYLVQEGNEGFNGIKLLESFFVSYAQDLAEGNDVHSLSHDFLTFTKGELLKLSTSTLPLLDKIMSLAVQLDTATAIEVSGLFRHWGHPVIDVVQGLADMHANVTKVVTADLKLMNKLAAQLEYLLLRNYSTGRFSKWPRGARIPMPVTSEERRLQECIRRNYFPSFQAALSFKTAWLQIEHGALFDRVEDINVLHLINDKRHAKNRSEILKLLQENRKISGSASVIETTLLTPTIDVWRFLEQVDQKGIDRDFLIILLREKERELKLKGRFFSLMTYTLRLYFTATEHLIEKFILPILPEITMCKDQLDFSRQMVESSERYENYATISHHMISIDFEKWNNFQRHESTFAVFQVMDRAFGWEHVISRTHEIFQNCTVIYAGKINEIPKDLSDAIPFCWNGQLGGFEGLRQKGWSVIGALLLRQVSIDTLTKIQVLLQGDNQVIIIRYRVAAGLSPQELEREKDRHKSLTRSFLSIFAALADSLGLHTKPEETWMSSRLLYYGKWAFVDGASQTLYLKRICRIFVVSNEIIPSITNCLSSLNTTCLSAGSQLAWSGLVYSFYLFFGSYLFTSLIRVNPVCGGNLLSVCREYTKAYFPEIWVNSKKLYDIEKWNPHANHKNSLLLIAILIKDASLGGIGGSGPLRYRIRQFPDPLTESLTGLKILHDASTDPDMKKLLVQIGTPRISKDLNYEILLQDPTCLNLSGISKSINMVKDFTKKQLYENREVLIQNQLIRAAFIIEKDLKDHLINYIMSVRPVFPRFLSTMYSVTPLAICETIVSKFTGTRTSFQLASKCNQLKELYDKLYSAEILTIIGLLFHMTTRCDVMWECSSSHADILRSKSWELEIIGVTVPHPAEQWEIIDSIADARSSPYPDDVIHLFTDLSGDSNSLETTLFTRGPFIPYLGGHTTERRLAQTDLEMKTSNSFMKGIIDLYNYENWCFQEGSSISSFVKRVMECYSPGCTENIMGHITITSGSLMHRYNNVRVSDGAGVCNNPNAYTHVCVSTNDLQTLGRGEDNKVILFQGIFVYWQLNFLMRRFFLNRFKNRAHLIIKCGTCVKDAPGFLLYTDAAPPEEISSLLTEPIIVDPEWALPSIPPDAELPEHPFEVPLDRIFVSPISTFMSVAPLRVQDDVLYTLIVESTALLICSRVPRLHVRGSLSKYKISTSVLRKIHWNDLKSAIVTMSLRLAWLAHLEMLSDNRKSPRHTEKHITNMAVDAWSMADEQVVGVVLDNSRIEEELMSEPVAHSADFPIKARQTGRSFILSIIEALSHNSTPPEDRDFSLLPGDFVNPSVVLMTGIIHKLNWVTQNVPLEDIFSLIRLGGSIERLVTVKELLSGSVARLNSLFQVTWSQVLDGHTVFYAQYDYKSLSEKVPSIPYGTSLRIDPIAIPPEESVRSAVSIWNQSTQLIGGCEANFERKGSPVLHIFRPIYHSANGTLKICSIIKALPPSYWKRAAIIGDGNGGFSRAIGLNDWCEKIWFNSLPNYQGCRNQEGGKVTPSAIVGCPTVVGKWVGKTDASSGYDITDPQWVDLVIRDWEASDFKPTIILSDAEFYEYGQMKFLLENLYRLRDICRSCIVKMHLNPIMGIKDAIPYMAQFTTMNVLRSPYSHMGKFEVYVFIEWLNHKVRRGIAHGLSVIPSDSVLATNEVFLNSYQMQLAEIRRWKSSKITRTHYAASLTLRYHVSKMINTPVGWLITLEGQYSAGAITMSGVFHQLLSWTTRRSIEHAMCNVESENLRGGNTLSRNILSRALGFIIGLAILYSVYRNLCILYTSACSVYNRGARVRFKTIEKSIYMQVMTLKGNSSERHKHNDYTLHATELKATIHDSVRYVSAIYWQVDHQTFTCDAQASSVELALAEQLHNLFTGGLELRWAASLREAVVPELPLINPLVFTVEFDKKQAYDDGGEGGEVDEI